MAVFGQKDWQQLTVIKRMAQDLNLPVHVVGRPIVREQDGLAMSSRNSYLDAEERRQASKIFAGLQQARQWVDQGCHQGQDLLTRLKKFYESEIPSGQIDYLELVHPLQLTPVEQITGQTLLAVAVYLGRARLIDNILLEG